MSRRIFFEEPATLLPQPQDAPLNPQGFVLFPMNWLNATPEQWAFQQWLYQQALEKAQAAERPSIIERDLLGYWN
jgi:hypothetical protein